MTKSSETLHENAQEKLFREAGFTIATSTALHGARVYELTSAECAGIRVAVLHTANKGLTLGGRIELSQSDLMGTSADSEQALLVLGALTAGLQPQGIEAHFLAGNQGLEGLMLSVHVCQDKGEPEQLKTQIARLARAAEAVAKALAQRGPDRLAAVRLAARLAEAAPAEVARVQVSVAPTFDLAARDRMMRGST